MECLTYGCRFAYGLNRIIKGLKVVNGQMVTTLFSIYIEYRFHFLMYIHHCSQDWLFTFTF